jgi:ATP-dependent RNA helicase
VPTTATPTLAPPPAPSTLAGIQQIGLDARVVEGLLALGITTPLPVQLAVIEAVRSGRDVLVAGKDGSGRTTAVGAALLNKVILSRGPQVLMISPTKDTAVETQRSIAAAGRYKRVKVHASFGGKSGDRAHIKSRKPQIVSATLGRALDNMKTGGPINPAVLHTLVVDDCDQMHRKFPTEMAQLFALLPPTCQIVLVSAGVGKLTRDWANHILRDPIKVDDVAPSPSDSAAARYAPPAYVVPSTLHALPGLTRSL